VNASYAGPLRDEPLAVELHNTLYTSGGELFDGLETGADLEAWLDALAERLPVRGSDVDLSRHAEFLTLRGAVRDALRAALAEEPVPAAALEVVNGAAARAPVSPAAVPGPDGRLLPEARHHGADATDVALGAFAADAVDLITHPDRAEVCACGAPGCVLLFLRDHPRRTWCCTTCGNRARQARHYERTRKARG
jgi:predicted RNA-binding Zn ribbon-like protein